MWVELILVGEGNMWVELILVGVVFNNQQKHQQLQHH